MPKVSVVILNWNGKRFLKDCLSSLAHTKYKPLEVILVDNNSSDGSGEYVKKYFPWVKLIKNKTNYGFAKGNNLGFQAATGEYVLFLNNDTKVTPDFLDIMIRDFQKDSTIGCIQPQMRVLNAPQLLDEAGAYLTPNGFLYHYGYRKDYSLSLYRSPREIFSAKGACMLIPRVVFQSVGKFDEDFFIFFEETDLCHRIWLSGYRVLYEPRSNIFHLAGGDTADKYSYGRRIYLTFKNMNMSFWQNFGVQNLLTIYPLFLVNQFLLFSYFLFTGKFYLVKEVSRACIWNLRNFRKILNKRRTIQHRRKISDKDLNRRILYNPGLYYYYCLLFNAQQFSDKPIPKTL
ncbi:MAG: glycosyltransferase family 2 protein [Patescibacteria group bacterium]